MPEPAQQSGNTYGSIFFGGGSCELFIYCNSLRHCAGPLAFGLQAQSRGYVKLVGVKGWFRDDDDDDAAADDDDEDDEDEEEEEEAEEDDDDHDHRG